MPFTTTHRHGCWGVDLAFASGEMLIMIAVSTLQTNPRLLGASLMMAENSSLAGGPVCAAQESASVLQQAEALAKVGRANASVAWLAQPHASWVLHDPSMAIRQICMLAHILLLLAFPKRYHCSRLCCLTLSLDRLLAYFANLPALWLSPRGQALWVVPFFYTKARHRTAALFVAFRAVTVARLPFKWQLPVGVFEWVIVVCIMNSVDHQLFGTSVSSLNEQITIFLAVAVLPAVFLWMWDYLEPALAASEQLPWRRAAFSNEEVPCGLSDAVHTPGASATPKTSLDSWHSADKRSSSEPCTDPLTACLPGPAPTASPDKAVAFHLLQLHAPDGPHSACDTPSQPAHTATDAPWVGRRTVAPLPALKLRWPSQSQSHSAVADAEPDACATANSTTPRQAGNDSRFGVPLAGATTGPGMYRWARASPASLAYKPRTAYSVMSVKVHTHPSSYHQYATQLRTAALSGPLAAQITALAPASGQQATIRGAVCVPGCVQLFTLLHTFTPAAAPPHTGCQLLMTGAAQQMNTTPPGAAQDAVTAQLLQCLPCADEVGQVDIQLLRLTQTPSPAQGTSSNSKLVCDAAEDHTQAVRLLWMTPAVCAGNSRVQGVQGGGQVSASCGQLPAAISGKGEAVQELDICLQVLSADAARDGVRVVVVVDQPSAAHQSVVVDCVMLLSADTTIPAQGGGSTVVLKVQLPDSATSHLGSLHVMVCPPSIRHKPSSSHQSAGSSNDSGSGGAAAAAPAPVVSKPLLYCAAQVPVLPRACVQELTSLLHTMHQDAHQQLAQTSDAPPEHPPSTLLSANVWQQYWVPFAGDLCMLLQHTAMELGSTSSTGSASPVKLLAMELAAYLQLNHCTATADLLEELYPHQVPATAEDSPGYDTLDTDVCCVDSDSSHALIGQAAAARVLDWDESGAAAATSAAQEVGETDTDLQGPALPVPDSTVSCDLPHQANPMMLPLDPAPVTALVTLPAPTTESDINPHAAADPPADIKQPSSPAVPVPVTGSIELQAERSSCATPLLSSVKQQLVSGRCSSCSTDSSVWSSPRDSLLMPVAASEATCKSSGMLSDTAIDTTQTDCSPASSITTPPPPSPAAALQQGMLSAQSAPAGSWWPMLRNSLFGYADSATESHFVQYHRVQNLALDNQATLVMLGFLLGMLAHSAHKKSWSWVEVTSYLVYLCALALSRSTKWLGRTSPRTSLHLPVCVMAILLLHLAFLLAASTLGAASPWHSHSTCLLSTGIMEPLLFRVPLKHSKFLAPGAALRAWCCCRSAGHPWCVVAAGLVLATYTLTSLTLDVWARCTFQAYQLSRCQPAAITQSVQTRQ